MRIAGIWPKIALLVIIAIVAFSLGYQWGWHSRQGEIQALNEVIKIQKTGEENNNRYTRYLENHIRNLEKELGIK